MRKMIALVVLGFVANGVFGQYRNTADAITYAAPMQIDSSDVYVIGTYVNKTNKAKYLLPSEMYGERRILTNILLYNAKNNKTTKVFKTQPVLVGTPMIMRGGGYGYSYDMGRMGITTTGILTRCIVYTVKTDDYNKDGVISEDDGNCIFVGSKDGEKLKQVTPANISVISWMPSLDQKTLLVTAKEDKNGDKNFTDEDEQLFTINLDDDFSKIKMVPINM